MSVCDFACLFVPLTSINMRTPKPLEISSRNLHGIIPVSKGRPSSKMAIVGCTAGDSMSDVLLCNVGANWRMTVKELTHTITEGCTGGEKMPLTYRYSVL